MKNYIVVTGPSGVGKTTLLGRIQKARPNLLFAVSWTTRLPRPGEGADNYTFVSVPQFLAAIRDGIFLEWVKVRDVYYGTPKPALASEERMLFDLDTQGGLALRSAYPNHTILLFITADKGEIRRRLEQREYGRMPTAILEARLARVEEETARAAEYYDHIILNDDIGSCLEQILRIIDET